MRPRLCQPLPNGNMNDISFIDTTVRDGNQSLWGNRMTTGMILPVAAQLDRAGFRAIEVEGLTPWKMRVRQQREEPWERIRLLSKLITRTPLSQLCGAASGTFQVAPMAFARLRLERFAANGIKRVQVTGFLNDMAFKVPEIVTFARNVGLEVVVGLIFTVSPRHGDDYYARKTRQALQLKPDRLYLKDPGGLLTPERTKTIIPAMQKNSGGLPLELHSHCTTGLAPLCYLEAIKLGITTLHTGIPPLANGPAQPSVLNIARNARLLGYNPLLDEEAIRPVSDHFRFIAEREGLPSGAPLEYDYGQYLHQVPGGVISNLERQLAEMKMGDRLGAVLDETIEVRRDLGYPIMVTPFSQHVVTQATINVMLGERYREVTDELIQYCLGFWGEEASSGVVAVVKVKILDRPRAEELARQEHYEPSVEEIRQKLGGTGVSDDELVVRFVMGGEEELKALRPAPPIREYPTARTPLASLIQDIMKRKNWHDVNIAGKNFALALKKA